MSFSQQRVILDADIDSDVDDIAALAMLHNFSKQRMVTLLGVIVTSDDPYAATCTDAVNLYFNNGRVPIAFDKSQTNLKHHSRYTKQISDSFPRNLRSYQQAWNPVELYRKLLSASPDNSVTIITIGHLSSLGALLKSEKDKYSGLTGIELVNKKVTRWICMGGMFPGGKEANFYRPDPASTAYCLKVWEKPVVFCGWEIGKEIISGGQELKKILPESNPVFQGFKLYNNFSGRPSWDQVAILLLVKKYHAFFDFVSNGICEVDSEGTNRWISGIASNHSYIKLKTGADPAKIAAIINNTCIK
jgi:inosine-uridine nucleoside N-ribohydrolase